MNDIALTLPEARPGRRMYSAAGSRAIALRAAFTYATFSLSMAFSFAVVLGVIH